MSGCRFCEIVRREKSSGFEQIIHETSSFIVIPAKGCFIKGYILILSKRHENSMSLLSQDEKKELVTLVNFFQNALQRKYSFFPLIFEHGDSPVHSDLSANSVIHAHMHIVPHKLKCSKFINELEMNRISKFDNYLEQSHYQPYLMFTNNECLTYYKPISENTEYQLFRKLIADDADLHDCWNWKEHNFIENIDDTVKIYECLYG